MPDSKITALTSISTSTDPANDPLVIVDVSDTSMAATGTTKKVTLNNLLACSPTATLASATITGDLTVRTNKLQVTSTGVGIGGASAAYPLEINGGASASTSQFKSSSASVITRFTDGTGETGYVGSGVSLMSGISRTDFGIASNGALVFGLSTGLAMTLNSTGLGVGESPVSGQKLTVNGNGSVRNGNRLYLWDTGNSTAHGIYNSGDNLTFSKNNGTTSMLLDSVGNVGIGVTPSAWATYKAVSVGGIGASVFGLGTSQAGIAQGAFFNNGAGSGWAYSATSQVPTYYLQINGENIWNIAASGTAGAQITAWTPAMKLDASGNLLVGTTNTSATAGVGFKSQFSSTVPQFAIVVNEAGTSSSLSIYNVNAAAYRFYVNNGGTVFATNTTISAISDARLKENVQDIDVGLGAILALKPRKFDWKAGKGKDIKGDRGFIAQEFEQVFPNLIDEWKDAAPEGEAPYKSVRQDLIPVLVKAIQELAAEVNALKNA